MTLFDSASWHPTSLRFIRIAFLVLAILAVVSGQGFKVYPGATKYAPPDTEETRQMLKALPPGTESAIYLADDSFDKVAAFYRGIGKEYVMPAVPGMPKTRKLPSGQELKQAYFMFDGAKDLTTSKSWVQVQRPFIGSIGQNLEYHDVRDVTVITVSQKK